MAKTKIVAGSTSSDYWKIEGDKATRVHQKERLYTFTPQTNNTCPGNGRTTDLWLFRLGEGRITKVRYVSTPEEEHVISEKWQHSTTSNELPEKWKGEMFFDYLPDEKVKKPVTTENQAPEQFDDIKATTIKGVDHWTKDGKVWTRHHVASRTKFSDQN